jgi:hypothetical protein
MDIIDHRSAWYYINGALLCLIIDTNGSSTIVSIMMMNSSTYCQQISSNIDSINDSFAVVVGE